MDPIYIVVISIPYEGDFIQGASLTLEGALALRDADANPCYDPEIRIYAPGDSNYTLY
jgi:hypothetical protein